MRLPNWIGCLSLFIFMNHAYSQTPEFEVSSFFPTGEASKVKTVKALFSEAIVPMGSAEKKAPFTSDCMNEGYGYWVDGKTWSFSFREQLPLGMKCTFTLLNELKSLAGGSLKGSREFSFSVTGFDVMINRPYVGATISEDQVLTAGFNAKVDLNSVRSNVFAKVEGILNPIEMKLIEGDKAKEIIKQLYRYQEDRSRYDILAFQATQRFPNSKKVTLVFQNGLKSESGTRLEQEQTYDYNVREPFRLSTTCTRDNEQKRCNPLMPIYFNFTNSISKSYLNKVILTNKEGKTLKPNAGSDDSRDYPISSFSLPSPLTPNDEIAVNIIGDIKDVDGRVLSNASAFPIKLGIDEYPPLAKFASNSGIIEFAQDAAIPVTVRNLEQETDVVEAKFNAYDSSFLSRGKSFFKQLLGSEPDLTSKFSEILKYYEKIESQKYNRSFHSKPMIEPDFREQTISKLKLPKVLPPKQMEVVGIPVKTPGFYVYEIHSKSLAESFLSKEEGTTMYVPGGYQVTNLGVHTKIGHENSLVWATSLDTGKPVPKAKITVMNCEYRPIWSGFAGSDGVAVIATNIQAQNKNCSSSHRSESGAEEEFDSDSYNRSGSPLYVFVQKGEDFAFAKSTWNNGIENWRWPFSEPYATTYPQIAHSILDRTLLRAGETVHFKHILRLESVTGFKYSDKKEYDQLEIIHLGSDEEFKVPITWGLSGSGESKWDIPKTAKLGSYLGYLTSSKNKSLRLHVASFDVKEFRVPLTKAFLKVPSEDLVGVSQFPLHIGVQYLSGGSLTNHKGDLVIQQNEVRYQFKSEKFKEFSFNRGVASIDGGYRDYNSNTDVENIPLSTNAEGQASYSVKAHQSDNRIDYHIEFNYLDPNGETRTYTANKSVLPDTWSVGIDSSKWLLKTKELPVTAALVNEKGEPLSHKHIEVKFFKVESLSHRKKVAGGVYSYENKRKLVELPESCSGTTDANGKYECKKMIKESGSIYAQVSAKNKTGKTLYSNQSFYLPGTPAEEVWLEGEANDRIDILTDKEEYEQGDTAVLQVKAPFRSATALVTMEREGIVSHKVVTLDGSDPTTEIKIEEAYSPNIFASVLVLRGRNDAIKPTALVDLGKPSFKLGKVELKVGWKKNRLKVTVKPEQDVYKVRENGKVKILVEREDGKKLTPNSEVAVAIVDEGLLELKPNMSWNLLETMMAQRPLAVSTFTSQMQIIGKRHFGQKAMNLGGDGGLGTSGNPRELFETLLSWQPKVPLNANGEGQITFKLNDSLTAFRIAAIATSGPSHYGTGYGKIITSKDIILFAGMPPLLRDEDILESKVTVRNTTNQKINAQITGLVKEINLKALDQRVELDPNSSKEIAFKLEKPLPAGSYTYETRAVVDQKEADLVLTKQKVIAVDSVQVQQAQLSYLSEPLKASYEMPEESLAGMGGIKVSGQASLITSLDSVHQFAREYPYSCFEQQLSKIVMLNDFDGFKKLSSNINNYFDQNGNLKFFPVMSEGSPELTAYAVQIVHANQWSWPDEALIRLRNALENNIKGNITRRSTNSKYELFIKLASMEALSRISKLDANSLELIKMDYSTSPISSLVNLASIIKRTPTLPNGADVLAKAVNAIQSRLMWSGSKIGFSSESDEHLPWMMVSADMSALLLTNFAIEFDMWKSDIGKYVKGSLSRMRRGHWDLTTATAWGATVARNFSKKFESEKVQGKTTATYAQTAKTLEWAGDVQPKAIDFDWKPGIQSLEINHQGSGTPWILVQSLAAMARKNSFGTGIYMTKTLEGKQNSDPKNPKVGDLFNVKIKFTANSKLDWVVINDPIPSGSTIIGKGLGGETSESTESGYTTPTFVEQSHEGLKAYYRELNDGPHEYQYLIRVNNVGEFKLPVTRIEAMYEPEIFVESPNNVFKVKN